MNNKHDSKNFIILEVSIGLLYLIILYKSGIFSGSAGVYTYCLVAVATLIAVAAIITCVIVSHRIGITDSMTGIGDADYVMSKGGSLRARKKISQYTAIFLNIKESKYMNEKFGSRTGDRILRSYAQGLQSYLKKKGFIGRMGGDNFFVYVRNEYFDEFMEHLKHLAVTVNFEGEDVNYKVRSRGGFLRLTDDEEYRDILHHASTALAIAKEKGPDFVRYDESMQKEHVAEKQILADYKDGIANGEFVPYYQPKVDTVTGRLCGAEALVRWIKDGEVIPPGRFVPVLEKNNKIDKLDFYIFEQVCRDQRKWLDMGLEPVCVSSNFSKGHFKNTNFAKEIIDVMNRYSLDGHYIEVELTESSCMEDFRLLKKFSEEIKAAGINLAIDDFGTGYSSLSMLDEFDADVVKLDKSFLDNASSGDGRSEVFLRNVINMISDLGEASLCEGVETKEQLEFLRDAGCRIIQGYYFDKPLPHDEFEKRIREPQYIR